jgi:predicted nucleic acid-binding protein
MPPRIATLDALVEEARQKEILLVTSMISVAEVAFAENERPPGALDPAKLALLDAMWDDREIIQLVEFHRAIAEAAREIMREGVHAGRTGIRSNDAIHLATAKDQGVEAFHTNDARLLEWNNVYFPVKPPIALRPMLPGMPGRE